MPDIMANTNNGNYPIFIQSGKLDRLGEIAASCVKGRKAFVVTDSNVAPLYLVRAVDALKKEGFSTPSCTVPAGESSKSRDILFMLFEQFNAAGVSRADVIVALGGGVIGDLTGFAAASYMRGCPFIQVPTTLLAQVDSSIGGKTGIDLPFGKNLVGAFYQPRAVLIDPSVLSTLTRSVTAEGMAEVIKYGCIRDRLLFESIEKGMSDLEWMIERCVRIKTTVVQNDEYDTGERMLLNFGHTIGHAIEKVSGYSGISHGEAVAIGMVYAAKTGESFGHTEKGTAERIRKLLKKWQLPVQTHIPVEEIFDAMMSDKKRLTGKFFFVFLSRIGEASAIPTEKDSLFERMKGVWDDE
ncbi:MAG: 3-dehydroquinate synthase [Clostridiaceae bacterium]|nr:3-dehydroquinate synthase [Clostridiaceae bacterium]